MYQNVEENTRHRHGQEPSLLDLILTNDNNAVRNIELSTPLGRSDHKVMCFDYSCYTKNEVQENVRWNYQKGDYATMRTSLNINWDEEFENKNVSEMLDSFTTKINAAMDHCIPKSKIRLTKGNTPINKETIKAIKKKHRLWERYMKDHSDEKYKDFCRARNKVKKLVRRDRKEKEKHIAETAKSNSKNFWKYVNSKRKNKSGVSELHVQSANGTFTANSNKDKAEVLADFFSSVFTHENSNETPNINASEATQTTVDDITQEEVRKLLSDLNTSKSQGPDKLHPKVLHELRTVIDRPIYLIFKQSLETGEVPENWKCATITALFKKGNRKSASNYRPVSLTSILCKIMEKVVRKRIIQHMDEHNLISNKQFGFVGGRSTTLQLLTVMNIWTEILDRGGEINSIYMDFMKAFDKVPHGRLIAKLRAYGINEKLCQWVENFLLDRKQCVQVNGEMSKWHKVTSGIPQGSVLGPVLFVIFINDMPNTVESDVFLYADDTKLFREITSESDSRTMQADLENLFKWSEIWLLKFHPDKCKSLPIFNPRSNQHDYKYKMRMYEGGYTTLETVHNEKDVGVTVDNNLSFELHIQTQINKANQIAGLMRRTFVYLNDKTFVLLFKALVRPHLEYASSVWSPYKKKDIEAIEKVQKRATKMLPKMQDTPYEQRLKRLKLPTLKFRRMRGDMIETYKILCGIYDGRVTSGLFTLMENSTTRGNSLKIKKERCSRDIRKYSFTNRVVDLWNSLPEYIVKANSVHQFENRLDKHWGWAPDEVRLHSGLQAPRRCCGGDAH